MSDALDRNFDHLAERFARRVYGGLKGEIRLAVLWADIEPIAAKLSANKGSPLSILDVGGGLGQIAIRLAQLGHRIVFNDVSPVMLAAAQQRAEQAGVAAQFSWHCGPYQTLPTQLAEHLTEQLTVQRAEQLTEQPVEHFLEHYIEQQPPGFDLILCHALLEWLEQPAKLVPTLAAMLAPAGYLSLCFYNPAAKVYRNLIRGNFNWLQAEALKRHDEGSLTPQNPSSLEQVRDWLTENKLEITSESGLRIFHDYVVERRGGHNDPAQVLKMELEYSHQAPYKFLARYLHIMAVKAETLPFGSGL